MKEYPGINLLVALILLTLVGCASGPEKQITTTSLESPGDAEKLGDEYKIGAQDLLDVEVFQVEDFSLTVRVNRHGLISLPLVGKIKATGLTSDQLQKRIASRLSDVYLQNPHVSVFIKEYTSQRVTVEGSVNKPGIFPITGRTTLLQVIATAEGMTNLADQGEVQLYRTIEGGKEGGKKQSYIFDIKSIRNGDSEDPVVRGNDIIVVQKSAPRSLIKSITDTLRGFLYFGNPFN